MKYTQIQFILLLFNLISGFYTQGQTPNIDSLKKLISTAAEDSNKVNQLNQLSELTQGNSPEQSLRFANDAKMLAEKISYKKGEALALKYIGLIYFMQNRNAEAVDFWQQSLNAYQVINDDAGMSNILYNLGSVNYNRGNLPRALEYYLWSLELAEKSGNKLGIANSLNNVGLCYMLKPATYDQAIIYLRKALKVAEEIKDYGIIGSSYGNIGEVYRNMQKDSIALLNFIKSKEAYEKTDDDNLPYTLNNIGKIYQKKKEYEKALEYHKEALKKSNENKNLLFIVQSDLEIAEIYRLQNQNVLAIEYFKSANTLSKEISSDIELKRSFDGLASSYSQLSDFRNAYNNQLKSTQISDSVYKLTVDNSRMAFEAEIKDGEIRTLKMDKGYSNLTIRNQIIAKNLAIGLIGLIIVGFILAINNVKRKRTNILLQKQKVEIEKTLADLRSAQRQLIQSEKMASLGEMTAGIAHEIQNPLNFVNNFSEVNKELLVDLHLEIDKGNLPEIREIAKDLMQNTEKINHHGQRADSIVKGMLQHSRNSKGQKEPTDLNALTDEYLRLAYHGQRAKDKSFNVILQTDFDQSIGKVNMIPQDIGRVLLNLYNNAFYAVTEKSKLSTTGYEPSVSVSTINLGDKLEIKVKDNGMGIPDIVKEKIFQPFFTTKPTGQGTGLGLSLSYDIIKAHQGSLNVDSKEGEFTEFTIQLLI